MAFSRVDFEGIWPVEPLEIDENDSRIRMPWWVTRVRWSIAAEGTQQDPSLKVGCNSFLFVTDRGNKRIEVWRQELVQAFGAHGTSRYDCSTITVCAFAFLLSLWCFELCSAISVIIWLMILLGSRTVPELFLRPHWAFTAAYREVLKFIGASIILITCLHLFELSTSVNCGANWARTCSECRYHGAAVPWCDGDCVFYDGDCVAWKSIPIMEPDERIEDSREPKPEIQEEPPEYWETPESQPDTGPSREPKAEEDVGAVQDGGVIDEKKDVVEHTEQEEKEDDTERNVPVPPAVKQQPELPGEVIWATDEPPSDVSEIVTDKRPVRHSVYSEAPMEGNPLVVLSCFIGFGILWKSGILFHNE